MQARWSDVDLAGGWLHVPAETRKDRKRDRQYRLSAEAVAALERIREPARELVYPWPLDPSSLYNHLRSILRAAGLTTDRRSKFHRLRRSHASYAEAAGLDATELLGHSSRAVTRGYLDPRIVRRVDPIAAIPRPHFSRPDPQGRLF